MEKNTINFEGYEIPFAECDEQMLIMLASNRFERRNRILEAFKNDIIQCLRDRMAACHDHFIKHIDHAVAIPYANGVFEYTYPDGHVGTFNTPSYEVMRDTIGTIENEKWDALNSRMLDQILKGFLNQPNRPESKVVNGQEIPFSNLVSLLMEGFGCSCYEDGRSMR